MSINIEELTSRKTEETFPNILVTHPNETLPVVIRTLSEGDMQLIVEFKGKRKCVARVSPSAINMQRLLRTVGSFEYVLGQNVSTTITCMDEYLSCVR